MKENGILYTSELFVEKLKLYFNEQAKSKPTLLGAEMEHFLIHKKTLESYQYHESGGQKEVLERLVQKGWDVLSEENGNLLGLKKNGTTITLEPGGQLEFSIKPCETVGEIDALYREIVREIKDLLDHDQALVSIGYHPKTKISDLPLLPKARYQMMFDYFKSHGRFCHNMMKGTASTQVSIDYGDEADFIRKFRVANFLSPIIANIFDSTPVFEGELYKKPNCRIAIWEETDIKRSKLIPGSLDTEFGFESYAKFLLKMPPILLISEGKLHYTGDQALETLLEKYPLTQADLEHILSMVFPDVRLKQFIEIRMADALPYPFNLAVVSLVKAIFYNEKNLNYFYELSKSYDDTWVRTQNHALTQSQFIMSEEFSDLTSKVLNSAIGALKGNGRELLSQLAGIRAREVSISNWLGRLYSQDSDAFLKTIAVTEAPYEN